MTTDAIGGASRARERYLDEDHSPALAKAGRQTAPAEIARGAVAAKIDADLAAFLGNVLDPKPTPKNDEILYVGLNLFSMKAEANALSSTGARVHQMSPSPPEVHDVDAFVRSLGLPPDVAKNVARVLEAAPEGDRGTLAEIAKVWANAERGGACPSRFVISGHSGNGNEIYGGAGVHLENVRKLAHAMPRAASQIEDLHVSACSSSGNSASSGTWRAAFPNTKSIWSYNGAAPSPASHHLIAWAGMTRGRGELPRLDGSLGREKVAIWTPSRGYEDRSVPLPTLRAQVQEARERFDVFMSGELVARPHRGPAENDFRALTDYANRPGIADADKKRAGGEASCLLRLRYYDNVRSEFAKRDGKAITEGFRAIGLATPDFAKLSRKDALAAIASFDAALARHPHPPASATAVASTLRGFASLDPNVVLERWCAE